MNGGPTDPIAEAVRAAIEDVHGVLGPAADLSLYARRIEFELRLIVDRKGTNFTLWDLGGGAALLSLAAAQLGAKATNVDDYGDQKATGHYAGLIDLLTRSGVRSIDHDLSLPIDFDEAVDVVTSMHTIEHMHSSPKSQYHAAAQALQPGGVMVIAGPNAANIRKRVSSVLGTTTWSPMKLWYESPGPFRGHVREPRAADLTYIASDLGVSAEIVGKNFIGQSHRGWRGGVARLVAPIIERRPTLCSDLYLICTKPALGARERPLGVSTLPTE